MKIKNFIDTLFKKKPLTNEARYTCLKNINATIYDNDNKKLDKLLTLKSTKKTIEEILNIKDESYKSNVEVDKNNLYEIFYKLIQKNNIKAIEAFLNLGLDINYDPVSVSFSCIQSNDNEKLNLFQYLLDKGLDINQVKKRYRAEKHDTTINLLISLFMNDSIYHRANTILTFDYSQKSIEKVEYQIFKKALNIGVKINYDINCDNLIFNALQTENKEILNDVLNIEGMTEDYLQKGIKETLKHYRLSDEVSNYLTVVSEKLRLTEKIQTQRPENIKIPNKNKI